MMNKSGENEYPCLVPELTGNAFSFSLVNMLAVGLPYLAFIMLRYDSLIAQLVKNLPAVWETWVPFLGQEDPLEKKIATHFSVLAWRIPLTEEPGGSQSRGSQRVGNGSVTKPPPPYYLCDHFLESLYHK